MGVIWGKREAEYFWGRGLDGANRIDCVQEISSLALRSKTQQVARMSVSDMWELDSEGGRCRRVHPGDAR
jgi:hypothetical protein